MLRHQYTDELFNKLLERNDEWSVENQTLELRSLEVGALILIADALFSLAWKGPDYGESS